MGDSFEAIVGPEHVSVGPGEAVDDVPVRAVVRPADAVEAAACLVHAGRDGLACVVRGGGTKLGWGHPPRSEHLFVLDLARLADELELDPDEGVASVAAGVSATRFADAARDVGQRAWLTTLDPLASVGGVIACDPLEPERTRDRSLRGDLLGLEVALANGEVARAGGRVVKNVTGFDLVRLYCGSFGTLGVITRATLRLRPQPEARRVLRRSFPGVAEALEGFGELVSRAGVGGASSEGVPLGGALPPDPDGAAVVGGPDGATLLWCLEGAATDVAARAELAPGETATDADWAGVRERMRERAAGLARVRISARPSDLHGLATTLRREFGAAAFGLALPIVGSLYARVDERRLGALIARFAGRGAAILVEHASPAARAANDVFGPPDSSVGLSRALKQRFDPGGVLAPGRFVGRI